MKCPKCGGNAEVSNWGSYTDPDFADFRVECEKCGYHSMGSTDLQKAKEMFANGMGMYYTNEQWFCRLSTKEKAEWIAKQKCDGCNDNPYDEKHGTCKYCMAKKTEKIREWLKQPHQKE